jgi:hypothetical protein
MKRVEVNHEAYTNIDNKKLANELLAFAIHEEDEEGKSSGQYRIGLLGNGHLGGRKIKITLVVEDV